MRILEVASLDGDSAVGDERQMRLGSIPTWSPMHKQDSSPRMDMPVGVCSEEVMVRMNLACRYVQQEEVMLVARD